MKVLLAAIAIGSAPAMAGWYQMIPPAKVSKQCANVETVDVGTCAMDSIALAAPISQWEQMGAFDTAAACEEQNLVSSKRADDRRAMASGRAEQLKAEIRSHRLLFGRCISANDPRLLQK